MTIIEVDGVSHLPHNVDSIQVFAAQRYSFIVSFIPAVFYNFVLKLTARAAQCKSADRKLLDPSVPQHYEVAEL